MIQVKWIKNSNNGLYIGYVCFRNMHFYSSGRNLNTLLRNMRQNIYKTIKKPLPEALRMDTNADPNGIDFRFASTKFITKFVNKMDEDYIAHRQKVEAKKKENEIKELIEVAQEELVRPEDKDEQYITKIKDDVMTVYKVSKVASYPLFIKTDDVKLELERVFAPNPAPNPQL